MPSNFYDALAEGVKREVEVWLVGQYGTNHPYAVAQFIRDGRPVVQVRLPKGAPAPELPFDIGGYGSDEVAVEVRVWLEAARSAAEAFQAWLDLRSPNLRNNFNGVGIGLGQVPNAPVTPYCVHVNLVRGFPANMDLPTEMLGVPVRYHVVGVIRAL